MIWDSSVGMLCAIEGLECYVVYIVIMTPWPVSEGTAVNSIDHEMAIQRKIRRYVREAKSAVISAPQSILEKSLLLLQTLNSNLPSIRFSTENLSWLSSVYTTRNLNKKWRERIFDIVSHFCSKYTVLRKSLVKLIL